MKQPDRPLCIILGGGGHASVLIDALVNAGSDLEIAILDADDSKWSTQVLGVPILGGDDMLPKIVSKSTPFFVVGLGSTSDNTPRKVLYERAFSLGVKPLTIIHPSAVCSKWATVGPGSVLLAGSIVNSGASLGANVIINSGAVVEHDCVIGDHVHVATGARMAAAVRVGECAHIGAGAIIRQGISVGENAVIGAGAVTLKDVPAEMVVVGVPARRLRDRKIADS